MWSQYLQYAGHFTIMCEIILFLPRPCEDPYNRMNDNCVDEAVPKGSSGCGFVLTICHACTIHVLFRVYVAFTPSHFLESMIHIPLTMNH